jgi:hypothetical protein
MDPRIGTVFAGHRIHRVIGSGGASVVYLAEHLRLGRRVALKVLAPHLADDEAFRERFIRESRIAAGLDHPNVVTVFDAGEVEGSLYISMRYVEGSDLRRILDEQGPLEPARAVGILGQIASALDAAHAEGLVHRDVKPANMLVEIRSATIARTCRTSASRSGRRPGRGSPGPGSSSARSTTSRPSRSAATPSTRGPTSTRSGASCSSACPGGSRSPARRASRRSTATSTTRLPPSIPRSGSGRASTASCRGRSRSRRRRASAAAAS